MASQDCSRLEWRCTQSGTNNDRWLIEHVFPGKTDGFYLELGMGPPIHESATYNLELLGWTGVSYEPNPKLFAHADQRRNPVLQLAVWSHTGDVEFTTPLTEAYRGGVTKARTTHQLSFDAAKGTESSRVQCISFRDVLANTGRNHIDAITIDIEGAELEVLNGFDPSKYTVGAWIIESAYPGQLMPLMASYGYRRAGNPFNTTARYEYYFLPR